MRRATANGQPFEDTRERGKPIVFTYGLRPFTGGMCRGAEEALGSMRAGGVLPEGSTEKQSQSPLGTPICTGHGGGRCTPHMTQH